MIHSLDNPRHLCVQYQLNENEASQIPWLAGCPVAFSNHPPMQGRSQLHQYVLSCRNLQQELWTPLHQTQHMKSHVPTSDERTLPLFCSSSQAWVDLAFLDSLQMLCPSLEKALK